MTTESTRAGTIRTTHTRTGIPTTTYPARAVLSYGRYEHVRSEFIARRMDFRTRRVVLYDNSNWWLPPTTSIAVAIGNGTATASMYTTTIIIPAGTCSSMPARTHRPRRVLRRALEFAAPVDTRRRNESAGRSSCSARHFFVNRTLRTAVRSGRDRAER